MKISIHPEAIINFNKKADALFNHLYKELTRPRSNSSKPDIEPKIILKEEDIISMKEYETFEHDGAIVRFDERGEAAIQSLTADIYRAGNVSKYVAANTIKNLIFKWIEDRYLERITGELFPTLIEQSEKLIETFSIWVPIAQTFLLDTEMTIGRVSFRTLTREHVDNLSDQLLNTDDSEPVREYLQNFRVELQSLACATIEVEAERQRASEIAFVEVDNAVAMLRCFAPGQSRPRLRQQLRPSWARISTFSTAFGCKR